MDALMLTLSVLLPWAAGVAWLRFLPRSQPLPWAIAIGYGHFVGLIALTLLMRAWSLTGVKWNFWGLVLLLVAFAAIPVFRTRARAAALERPRLSGEWHSMERWKRIAIGLLLAWIAVRFAGLLLEIIWRPLFPWDAWMQWATKARVWFEHGRILPFEPFDIWIASNPATVFIDPAPGYPATVPLLQVWTCLALGRWDDALMNMPWFACGVALGFGFWGQVRAWGAPLLLAAVATYLLLTIPFVDTHVALAGYAELHMAAMYGLGAMAFFLWARDGDRRQGWLALVLVLALPLIKKPGIFWALSFLPAFLVLMRPRVAGLALAAAAALGIVVMFVLRETGMRVFGYALTSDVNAGEVTTALAQNLFEMGNWNLFFWLLLAAMAAAWRKLFDGALGLITTMTLFGIYFLGIVFYFSVASEWVSDFSTVNRAVFHMVPLAAFLLVALVMRRFYSPPDPPRLV